MLQIRRGNRYNLGIMSHISPQIIFCDPSLEQSRRDGTNKGSQHMFSLRNKNIFELSSIPYFLGYKTDFFSFQNNPKDLDPSYKTDLDL